MERKEKSGGLLTGIFCALAGIAVGVGGKLIYDEINSKETDEQKKREEALNQIRNDRKKEKEEKVKDLGYDDTAGFSDAEYESFFCPISQEIMLDPVITPQGISYDRRSILDWLKKSHKCPITKTTLCEKELITNYALKNTINDYLRKVNQQNKNR
jgi:hypothetical protein